VNVPKRIQLSRKKGWRLPAGTLHVARPGPWGNPFRVGGVGPDGEPITTREDAVALYHAHVATAPPGHRYDELRGHDLACWCPLDGPCHADVLLERANRSPE
jgi:hypothetical protein